MFELYWDYDILLGVGVYHIELSGFMCVSPFDIKTKILKMEIKIMFLLY